MGMYHKNRVTTLAIKREAKKRTSKGMRRAAKKAVRMTVSPYRVNRRICMASIHGSLAE